MTIPLMVLAFMSIIVSGFNTADKGWFSKYAAPYDVAAIAAEFPHIGAGEHLQMVHDEYGASDHAPAEEAEHGHGGHADEHAAAAADHGHGQEAAHGEEHGGHDDHHAIHHKAHNMAMGMSILMVILGIGSSWWVYHQHKIDPSKIQARLHGVYTILQGQYFFDELYAATVYRFTLWWANVCAAFDRIVVDGIVNGTAYLTRGASFVSGSIDRYLVDGAVNGVASVLQGFGEVFRRVQTGRVQTYLVYVSASVLVLVLVYKVL